MPEISDEDYAELQQRRDDDSARRLYGEPSIGGATGGGPPAPRLSEREAEIRDIQHRMTAPGESYTIQDTERFAQLIGASTLAVQIAQNPSSPLVRKGGLTLGALVREGVISQRDMDEITGHAPAPQRARSRERPAAIPRRRR